jgi:hypothetical protein
MSVFCISAVFRSFRLRFAVSAVLPVPQFRVPQFPQFPQVSAVSVCGSPCSAIDHTEGLLFVSPSLIEERRSGMVFLSMMRNGLESGVFRMICSMSSAEFLSRTLFAGACRLHLVNLFN